MKIYEISIKISLKFVPRGPINNIPALVLIMAWRHPSDKPLSEPMMVSLLMHTCITRPQWVNQQMESWHCWQYLPRMQGILTKDLPCQLSVWTRNEMRYWSMGKCLSHYIHNFLKGSLQAKFSYVKYWIKILNFHLDVLQGMLLNITQHWSNVMKITEEDYLLTLKWKSNFFQNAILFF